MIASSVVLHEEPVAAHDLDAIELSRHKTGVCSLTCVSKYQANPWSRIFPIFWNVGDHKDVGAT